MPQPGTQSNPLRVAILGSGPAAFYAAEQLFKQVNLAVEVDMFDRLPTPYGLVRGGVAPDHQKIKSVTKAYQAIAGRPGFRFYGNVEYGRHLGLADLQAHFHQIVFATGAQTDKRLGIPGEDLQGSYPATEFGGVELEIEMGKPSFGFERNVFAFEDPLVRGLGSIIPLDGFVANPFFGNPLERGLKEVDVYLARSQIAVFYCLYRGAKAACSVHGSPSGWHNKSVETDFHELRQDFSPLSRRRRRRKKACRRETACKITT